MRPKFFVSALGSTLVLLGLLWYVRPRNSDPVAEGREIQADRIALLNSGANLEAPSKADDSPNQGATVVESNARDSFREAPPKPKQIDVEARGAELMQLAMNDDSTSLEAILTELGNTNRAIRNTALQAAVQFGSRDAIPRLTEAASAAADAEEKAAIVEAIELLKLPSLSEAMAQSSQSSSSQRTEAPTKP